MKTYWRTARVSVLLVAAVAALGGCAIEEITPTKAIGDLSLTKAAPDAVAQEHFVTNWLVLGPFTFKADDFGGGHQQPSADKAFMPGERGLNGTQAAPKPAAWTEKQFSDSRFTGRVDLEELYGKIDHAAAYAVCWVYCPEKITGATLLTGSDDYITVWINGKAVHTYKVERRAGRADQDKIENVTLKKGFNRIVVKCVDDVFSSNF